jgi:peptide/histidine transporter 3/4
MSLELDSSFESVRLREINCAPKCGKVKWIKNKGAILIILWSFLVGGVFHLLRAGYNENIVNHVSNTGLILISSTLLYPLGGWLADTRLGRYTVISYSMRIMWIGSLLLTTNEVLADVHAVQVAFRTWTFRCLCIIMAIALGGFQSNIIQLGIDQLSDASSTEITSFITWYTVTFFASGTVLHYTSDCIQNVYNVLYIRAFVSSLCLSLALCSDFLFQHTLTKEQISGKPLQTILKVLLYTFKNRKFRYNFMHNEEPVSTFDIATHRYGGPCTAQQVENVRTFLWMITVIASFAVFCGILFPLEYAQDKMMYNSVSWEGNTTLPTCYAKLSVHYFGYMFVIAVIFLYEFFVCPLFSSCIPRLSTVSMFILGAVLVVLWIISLLIMESVAYSTRLFYGKCLFTDSKIELDYKWFLLPKSIHGITSLLFIVSSFKFIWSQAPLTMKGIMFGFGYFFLGLSALLHIALASLFLFEWPVTVSWDHAKLTCGIWYYAMEGLITLVAVVLITIVVQIYKKKNSRHTTQ